MSKSLQIIFGLAALSVSFSASAVTGAVGQVPTPGPLALLGIGALALFFARMKK